MFIGSVSNFGRTTQEHAEPTARIHILTLPSSGSSTQCGLVGALLLLSSPARYIQQHWARSTESARASHDEAISPLACIIRRPAVSEVVDISRHRTQCLQSCRATDTNIADAVLDQQQQEQEQEHRMYSIIVRTISIRAPFLLLYFEHDVLALRPKHPHHATSTHLCSTSPPFHLSRLPYSGHHALSKKNVYPVHLALVHQLHRGPRSQSQSFDKLVSVRANTTAAAPFLYYAGTDFAYYMLLFRLRITSHRLTKEQTTR